MEKKSHFIVELHKNDLHILGYYGGTNSYFITKSFDRKGVGLLSLTVFWAQHMKSGAQPLPFTVFNLLWFEMVPIFLW